MTREMTTIRPMDIQIDIWLPYTSIFDLLIVYILMKVEFDLPARLSNLEKNSYLHDYYELHVD